MRILDGYIAREVLLPLVFGVAAFTGLFVGGNALNLARTAVDTGAPMGAIAKVFVLQLPQTAVWTLPMAVLFGALLGLSRLSSTSEIVAMRAGGISFYRLAAPVLTLGVLVGALTFFIEDTVVPAANEEAERLTIVDIQHGHLPHLTPNVVLKQFDGGELTGFVYAREFDSDTDTMQDVTVLHLAEGRPKAIEYAEKVKWDQHSSQWTMEGGTTTLLGDVDQPSAVLTFGHGSEPVAIAQRPADIANLQKKPDQMRYRELAKQIAVMRQAGQPIKDLAVQLYEKLALPAAALVFAIMGAALGVQSHRTASSIGFGLSIVIIFVYYVVMSVGSALGSGGYIPPWLGAWLQDLLLGGAGIYLLVSRAR